MKETNTDNEPYANVYVIRDCNGEVLAAAVGKEQLYDTKSSYKFDDSLTPLSEEKVAEVPEVNAE